MGARSLIAVTLAGAMLVHGSTARAGARRAIHAHCDIERSEGFDTARLIVDNAGDQPVRLRLRAELQSSGDLWRSSTTEHSVPRGSRIERRVRPFARGRRVEGCRAIIDGVVPTAAPPTSGLLLEHTLWLGARPGSPHGLAAGFSFDVGLRFGSPRGRGFGLGLGGGMLGNADDDFGFVRLTPRYRTSMSEARWEGGLVLGAGFGDGPARALVGAGARVGGSGIHLGLELLATRRRETQALGDGRLAERARTSWTALVGPTIVPSEGRAGWVALGIEAALISVLLAATAATYGRRF